jgi:hypothetical protein
MRSSSGWLSPTDSAHIKWVVNALNSTVLRCWSSWGASNREASRHAFRSLLRASNSFSWSSNKPQVGQSSENYAAGQVGKSADKETRPDRRSIDPDSITASVLTAGTFRMQPSPFLAAPVKKDLTKRWSNKRLTATAQPCHIVKSSCYTPLAVCCYCPCSPSCYTICGCGSAVN